TVGLSEGGRTFASLVTELRGYGEVYSVTPYHPRAIRQRQLPPTLKSRELELLRSIELGEITHARALMGAGVSANTKDRHGWTPLMLAALHDRITLVPVLSAHGADPNTKNVKGITALMLAANNGHREMVRLLIEHGALVNAKTTGGWTALMYAAWRGHTAIA